MNRKDITQLFKRFLITFACSLPLLILVGVLLDSKVSDFVMVVVFVAVAGVIIAAEELIFRKLYLKRKQQRESSTDGSHFGDEVAREEKIKEEKLARKKARKEARKKK